MTTGPTSASTGARHDAWLRRTVPHASQISALLRQGAVFAWSEDRWIIAWGRPRRAELPDPERPSFYAPDFFLRDPEPWRIYPEAAAVSPDGLAQVLTAPATGRSWQPFDEEGFAAAFHRVKDAIGRGDLQKAVPVVFDTSAEPLSMDERARALHRMANLPAGLMPYGSWDGSEGAMGASPELLFEDDGVEIHTMAVAGTARAGTVPDDIMEDPKERSEHQLVIDDLEAQLAPMGKVAHGATRLWRIGILSHLRTDLRLTPGRTVPFNELVRQLHPTPAVGTAPRTSWLEWLPLIDSSPRGRFAAPFGLVLPGGGARCIVGIRQVQWDANATRCGAGCGIVVRSDLARETAELHLKLTASRGNLGL